MQDLSHCLYSRCQARSERNVGNLFKRIASTLRGLFLFGIVSTCYEVRCIVGYRNWCGKILSGVCKDGNGGDESDMHSLASREAFWIWDGFE